ncbi:hypothetical protein CLV40_13838 [Actinokineospora auranticolor]|uniref:Uncharacterized protein n=1 Tax=Actinokineospora auranticolor TaxID=155976 RepID=A0A2S6GC03_9PSEU|nr:hypothetical protein CLV40_13838 [Actinokineospora auranticolor]
MLAAAGPRRTVWGRRSGCGGCNPSRPKRSGSAATSPVPRGQASTNTLSRRWAAPMSEARTLRQSASYPASARSPSTRWSPPPAQRSAATFSTRTSVGRSRRTAAMMWVQSPLRAPFSMPARFPAAEMSWQGNPAVSTSTGSTTDQSTERTSPRFGTSGIRAARIRVTCGSGSATQASRPPSTASTPRSRPPAPVHNDPTTGPTSPPTRVLGPGRVGGFVAVVARSERFTPVLMPTGTVCRASPWQPGSRAPEHRRACPPRRCRRCWCVGHPLSSFVRRRCPDRTLWPGPARCGEPKGLKGKLTRFQNS